MVPGALAVGVRDGVGDDREGLRGERVAGRGALDGVGELVSAFTTATNRGGKLKLVNLPPKVNDILQITQLITVFEVFESEDEAIKSF